MMRNALKLDVKKILDVLVILFAWLGLFGHFISVNLGGAVYVLFGYLLFVMEILLEQNKVAGIKVLYLKSAGVFAAFCILYFFLSMFFETAGLGTSLFALPAVSYNLLISIPVWFASGILLLKCDERRQIFYTELLFWILLYDIVITTTALVFIPEYARNSAAAIVTKGMSKFTNLGAMGYELTYSIAILVPAFFYTARLTGKKRWGFLGLLGAVFVLKSQFVIGIVALFLNIFLSWSLSRKSPVIRIVLVLVLVLAGIIVVANSTVIGTLLIAFGGSMSQNAVSLRIIELGKLFMSGSISGDTQIRLSLYQKSLEGILQHPILGNKFFDAEYELSGHSTLMDLWDGYGLLPLSLFIIFGIYAYRYATAVTGSFQKVRVLQAAYLTFFFIALLNPVLASPQMVLTVLFVLPFLASGIWTEKNRDI